MGYQNSEQKSQCGNRSYRKDQRSAEVPRELNDISITKIDLTFTFVTIKIYQNIGFLSINFLFLHRKRREQQARFVLIRRSSCETY